MQNHKQSDESEVDFSISPHHPLPDSVPYANPPTHSPITSEFDNQHDYNNTSFNNNNKPNNSHTQQQQDTNNSIIINPNTNSTTKLPPTNSNTTTIPEYNHNNGQFTPVLCSQPQRDVTHEYLSSINSISLNDTSFDCDQLDGFDDILNGNIQLDDNNHTKQETTIQINPIITQTNQQFDHHPQNSSTLDNNINNTDDEPHTNPHMNTHVDHFHEAASTLSDSAISNTYQHSDLDEDHEYTDYDDDDDDNESDNETIQDHQSLLKSSKTNHSSSRNEKSNPLIHQHHGVGRDDVGLDDLYLEKATQLTTREKCIKFCKVFFWVVLVLAIVITVFIYFRKLRALVYRIMKYKIGGYFILYISFTLQALLCLPTLPLVLAGGYTYGVPIGTAVITISSISTATLSFLISRYMLRDYCRSKLGIKEDTSNNKDDIFLTDRYTTKRQRRRRVGTRHITNSDTTPKKHSTIAILSRGIDGRRKSSERINKSKKLSQLHFDIDDTNNNTNNNNITNNNTNTKAAHIDDDDNNTINFSALNTIHDENSTPTNWGNTIDTHEPHLNNNPQINTTHNNSTPSHNTMDSLDITKNDTDPLVVNSTNTNNNNQHHENTKSQSLILKTPSKSTPKLNTTNKLVAAEQANNNTTVKSIDEDVPNFWTQIDQVIGEDGFTLVFLLRFSPLHPYGLFNYMFGVTSVPLIPYIFGSLISLLPTILMEVYMGSALRNVGEIINVSKNIQNVPIAPGEGSTNSLLPNIPVFGNGDSDDAIDSNDLRSIDKSDPTLTDHHYNSQIPENEHNIVTHERQNIVFWCGLIFTLLSALFLTLYIKTKLKEKLASLHQRKKKQQQLQREQLQQEMHLRRNRGHSTRVRSGSSAFTKSISTLPRDNVPSNAETGDVVIDVNNNIDDGDYNKNDNHHVRFASKPQQITFIVKPRTQRKRSSSVSANR